MPLIDHEAARLILATFLLTFISARTVVLLIMLRRIPTLYLRTHGGTHIHHLNYGIFLLSFVGGYVLLVHPTGPWLQVATILYGIGLALTFDEFGMWVHLGGPYWQRASFDAVTVVASLLGLLVVAPDLARFRAHHWTMAIVLLAAAALYGFLLVRSLRFAHQRVSPFFEQIESHGPEE